MKLAIDIGSNTIKCLLARPDGNGGLEKIFERTLESRISAGRGRLVEGAADIVSRAVSELVAGARNFAADFETSAVATSALRDAPNREAVAQAVLRATGVRVKILSGEEEARLSYLGACSDPAVAAHKTKAYFDLGGGSMEIVFGEGLEVKSYASLPVGAVSLQKMFCPFELVSERQMEEIRQYVLRALGAVKMESFGVLVGAGGAVAAARLLNEKINSVRSNIVPRGCLCEFASILSRMTAAERAEKFLIAKSRADILISALLCVDALLERSGREYLLHTFNNLRYGIILYGNQE